MATGQLNAVLRRLELLFRGGGVAGMSEGQLLERFISRRDEVAFEALVARHGPMVLGVCRQVLRDPNDVEDAFQATFLVLTRKAATLRDRTLLGNWLHGVAYRVALRARSVAARRRATETDGVADLADDAPAESRPWLHEEIQRLPEKYRAPVVLCYLEGLTHEQAADHLGWPVGTVKGRLARARDLLRSRLTRRGLAGAALLAGWSRDASATVPATLIESTVQAAAPGAAGLLSTPVVALTEGVLHAMLLTKLKVVGMLIVAGVVVAGSAGTFAQLGPPRPVAKAPIRTEPAGPADPFARPIESSKTQAALAEGLFESLLNQERKDGWKGLDGLAKWSSRKMKSESIAAPTDADKVAAALAHFERMNLLSLLVERDSGKDHPDHVDHAQHLLSEAEHHLERLKEETSQPHSAAMGGGGMGGGAGGDFDDTDLVQIAREITRLQARDTSPATVALRKVLDQPIKMEFAMETPLEDVLKYIKDVSSDKGGKGIPVYIDPIGLNESEKTLSSPISIELEGVPLKTSLRLLLKQLGLAYCVKDGLLFISSPSGVRDELRETTEDAEQPPTFPGGGPAARDNL